MTALSDRSFGALFILIAAPNLIPLPPGSSFIFSVPLIFIAVQLVLGRSFPWLPASILDRRFDRSILKSLAERLGPSLARLEGMLKPRLAILRPRLLDRIVGLLALIAARSLAARPTPLPAPTLPAWWLFSAIQLFFSATPFASPEIQLCSLKFSFFFAGPIDAARLVQRNSAFFSARPASAPRSSLSAFSRLGLGNKGLTAVFPPKKRKVCARSLSENCGA